MNKINWIHPQRDTPEQPDEMSKIHSTTHRVWLETTEVECLKCTKGCTSPSTDIFKRKLQTAECRHRLTVRSAFKMKIIKCRAGVRIYWCNLIKPKGKQENLISQLQCLALLHATLSTVKTLFTPLSCVPFSTPHALAWHSKWCMGSREC